MTVFQHLGKWIMSLLKWFLKLVASKIYKNNFALELGKKEKVSYNKYSRTTQEMVPISKGSYSFTVWLIRL